VSTIKLISATTIIAFLTCATLFGQSAAPVDRPRTCHIHGTIRTYTGSAVLRAEVRFEGDKFSRTVPADEGGSYDVDLPVGLYTMTAQPGDPYLQEFQRPLFRAGSSKILTLNVTFDLAQATCDLVSPVGGPRPNADTARNVCGGWDFFPVPSEDGVAFQLFIQYRSRRPTDHGYAYSTREYPLDVETPVFVAYNLFTLRADKVVYDVQSRTLEATGNVVAAKADGATEHADSMKFRVENGEAIPLASTLVKR
jgi:hypothetical protein